MSETLVPEKKLTEKEVTESLLMSIVNDTYTIISLSDGCVTNECTAHPWVDNIITAGTLYDETGWVHSVTISTPDRKIGISFHEVNLGDRRILRNMEIINGAEVKKASEIDLNSLVIVANEFSKGVGIMTYMREERRLQRTIDRGHYMKKISGRFTSNYSLPAYPSVAYPLLS